MSVNRWRPHLVILPEDDANRQIANGFILHVDTSQILVLNEARGWSHVCKLFESDHVSEMRQFGDRSMLLVVDFDGQIDRPDRVRSHIPDDLRDRVHVVGALNDPEDLRRELTVSFESTGAEIARSCHGEDDAFWQHRLLKHNADEIDRLRAVCRRL